MKVIPSGLDSFDRAIGVGGYPCGHITHIHGPAVTNKSTMALKAVAEFQKKGGWAAVYIDCSHSFNVDRARSLGVDMGWLMVSQPESLEHALRILKVSAKTGMALIVLDGYETLPIESQAVGNRGILMANALVDSLGVGYETGPTILIIDSLSDHCKTLKYSSSVRVCMSKHPGGGYKAEFTKNRVWSPFRTAILEEVQS